MSELRKFKDDCLKHYSDDNLSLFQASDKKVELGSFSYRIVEIWGTFSAHTVGFLVGGVVTFVAWLLLAPIEELLSTCMPRTLTKWRTDVPIKLSVFRSFLTESSLTVAVAVMVLPILLVTLIATAFVDVAKCLSSCSNQSSTLRF